MNIKSKSHFEKMNSYLLKDDYGISHFDDNKGIYIVSFEMTENFVNSFYFHENFNFVRRQMLGYFTKHQDIYILSKKAMLFYTTKEDYILLYR